MSVWLCLPSARPAAECEPVFAQWKAQGYMLAIQRDPGQLYDSPSVDMMFERTYAGYPESVNWLAKMVLRHRDTDWIVAAGDDTLPDPNHTADEIGDMCSDQCGELAGGEHKWIGQRMGGSPVDASSTEWVSFCDKCGIEYFPADCVDLVPKCVSTFGVMQPTGDRWSDSLGVIIERIAGSPWLGREWCLRANQGEGPLWREYWHNWADEELQLVATKLGCFWQRPDIIHMHEHSMRKPGGQWKPHQQGFSADYKRMEPLFRARKAAGFPGSEPL